ncbi:hypothetical protein TDB9533_02544 [Thalassocella blandensis]|nr:hypothetical protein TDB9533_02544 [Thalassocella blandensis]
MKNEIYSIILQQSQRLILMHGYAKVTMKDIAQACEISRPTLYKMFPNKISVLNALIEEGTKASRRDSLRIVEGEQLLSAKLEEFFEIWTVRSAVTAINSESGHDILMNVSSYAPEAVEKHYKTFEVALTSLIKDSMKDQKELSASDLAHILTLAAKGLKASSGNIKDLKRMISGLIKITVAAIEK